MAGLALRLALGVASLSFAAACARSPGATDWPSTNYAQSANRYSPLTQITAENVATLQQVWSFHLRPADYPGRLQQDESPIVSDPQAGKGYRQDQPQESQELAPYKNAKQYRNRL